MGGWSSGTVRNGDWHHRLQQRHRRFLRLVQHSLDGKSTFVPGYWSQIQWPAQQKGATLGAYGLDGRLPYRTNTVNLATMMVRTANGGDRFAYSRKGNGLGTSTAVRELGTVVPLSVERIYEVKRDANGISYSVYASDTDFSGSPIPLLTTTLGYYNAATPDTTLHADITASYPMYAGFTVQGANLEISNLVISDDSVPL